MFRAIEKIKVQRDTGFRATNDLVISQKYRKEKGKDPVLVEMLRISRKQMKETGIEGLYGIRVLVDEEPGKPTSIYLAVVPREKAQAFQGRKQETTKDKDFVKSNESACPELVTELVKVGLLPEERPIDLKTAFSFEKSSDELLEGAKEAIDEDIIGLYKLAPAELINVRSKADGEEGEEESEEEETEQEEVEEEEEEGTNF